MSTDWKSISAAGAQAAIGNSIPVSGAGSRNLSFFFSAIRPSSQYIADGNGAGNAAGVGSTRNIWQLRPWSGSAEPCRSLLYVRNACLLSLLQLICAPLVSRSPRTLGRLVNPYEGVRAFVPPVPVWPSDDVSDDGSGSLSPRQTQGPLTLTPENNKARIKENRLVSPSSLERPGDESQMDEVMPLLSVNFLLSSISFFPFSFLPYLPSSDAHRDRPLLHRGRRLPVLCPSSTNPLPSQTYRLFFLYGPNQPRHVP